MDVFVAAAALVVLCPLMFVVSTAVFFTSSGGILFAHERIGRNRRAFRVLKFRTMYSNSAGSPITVSGDSRITPIGRWLRRYKIDELPQLINVLRGEMSIVGPRPEVRKYVDLLPGPYAVILSVRPGITDYASVAFRHEERLLAMSVDPERTYVHDILPMKVDLALRYVATMSLRTDVDLLIATVRALIN